MARILITIIILLTINIHFSSCQEPDYTQTTVQTAPPISTGMYMIEAQLSSKVLQVAANGKVQQGNLDPNSNNSTQKFYLVSIKDNLYYLLGAENRKIIELAANEITVQERQNWNFSEVDAWRVLAGTDGYFYLQHVMTAKYLAVKSSTAATVYMTNTTSGTGTLFKFTRVIVDGVYTIKATGSSDYLRFKNNIVLLQTTSNASTAQQFFIKTSGTEISIINFKNNKALTVAKRNNITQALIGNYTKGAPSQKLIPIANGTNSFTFQSVSTKYFLKPCQPTNFTSKDQLCLSVNETTTTFELIQDLELPLKRYNERAYLSTHNSYASVDTGFFLYPQHEGNITYQLQSGARSVNFDIWHIKPDKPPQDILMLPDVSEWLTTLFDVAGIYVFHNLRERGYIPGGTTALPAKRLYPLVQEVVDFVKANPSEIVHIEYEDDGWREVGVPPGPDFDLLKQEYAMVNGMNEFVFKLDNDPLLAVAPTRQWPLISDMIKTNRRLILLPKHNYYTDAQAKQLPLSVGRYINMLPHILESGVFTAGNDYTCDGFETDMTQFNASTPLYYIPHMRNFPVNQLLSFSDNEFFTLWSRIEECNRLGWKMINTILIDWSQTPFHEPNIVIQKLNDPSTPVPTRFAQCRRSYARDWTEAAEDVLDFLKGESQDERTCPPGADDDILLDECVLPCPAGYESDLLGINCLCNCQEGTSEVLTTCTRVDDSYTRELYSSRSKCQSDSGKSCSGLLWTWYPDCDDGYTGVLGLCISSRCPTGTTEVLGICNRNTIPRVRQSPYCKDSTLEYIPRFCLERCQPGFKTVEVLGIPTIGCESDTCPKGFTVCHDRCIKNGDCSLIPDILTPNPVCNLD